MANGTEIASAVIGRVRIKTPNASPDSIVNHHCFLVLPGVSSSFLSWVSQNAPSQPRANNSLKTSPNGCDNNEAEFIKKNGEVTVSPAANSPTSSLKKRFPSLNVSQTPSPANNGLTHARIPNWMARDNIAGHPGGYLPKRFPW